MDTFSRLPETEQASKKASLPQTTLESSRRKTAMGRGKFIRVLFLAFSAS